jgi:hypothetical protein
VYQAPEGMMVGLCLILRAMALKGIAGCGGRPQQEDRSEQPSDETMAFA